MTGLTEQDYKRAAALLRCEVVAIKAVDAVESSGAGFLADGRVKVLFEGHQFYKYCGGRFAASHPTLCFPRWDRAHYAKGKNAEERGAGEWIRLGQAMLLDPVPALMSASYGRFQIMGFNFALCGFTSVQDFVVSLKSGEAAHLDAFCKYVISVGIDDELRGLQWDRFARRYNGPEYKKNRYDSKLLTAYKTAKAAP